MGPTTPAIDEDTMIVLGYALGVVALIVLIFIWVLVYCLCCRDDRRSWYKRASGRYMAPNSHLSRQGQLPEIPPEVEAGIDVGPPLPPGHPAENYQAVDNDGFDMNDPIYSYCDFATSAPSYQAPVPLESRAYEGLTKEKQESSAPEVKSTANNQKVLQVLAVNPSRIAHRILSFSNGNYVDVLPEPADIEITEKTVNPYDDKMPHIRRNSTVLLPATTTSVETPASAILLPNTTSNTETPTSTVQLPVVAINAETPASTVLLPVVATNAETPASTVLLPVTATNAETPASMVLLPATTTNLETSTSTVHLPATATSAELPASTVVLRAITMNEETSASTVILPAITTGAETPNSTVLPPAAAPNIEKPASHELPSTTATTYAETPAATVLMPATATNAETLASTETLPTTTTSNMETSPSPVILPTTTTTNINMQASDVSVIVPCNIEVSDSPVTIPHKIETLKPPATLPRKKKALNTLVTVPNRSSNSPATLPRKARTLNLAVTTFDNTQTQNSDENTQTQNSDENVPTIQISKPDENKVDSAEISDILVEKTPEILKVGDVTVEKVSSEVSRGAEVIAGPLRLPIDNKVYFDDPDEGSDADSVSNVDSGITSSYQTDDDLTDDKEFYCSESYENLVDTSISKIDLQAEEKDSKLTENEIYIGGSKTQTSPTGELETFPKPLSDHDKSTFDSRNVPSTICNAGHGAGSDDESSDEIYTNVIPIPRPRRRRSANDILQEDYENSPSLELDSSAECERSLPTPIPRQATYPPPYDQIVDYGQ